jgi:hypothetical protein
MQQDKERFLNLKLVPARLTAEETAWCLGFAAHDIPVLVAKGLLKPLGHPADNAVKFFALVALEPLRSDTKWLFRATDAMLDHWRTKNARKAIESISKMSSSPTLPSNCLSLWDWKGYLPGVARGNVLPHLGDGGADFMTSSQVRHCKM